MLVTVSIGAGLSPAHSADPAAARAIASVVGGAGVLIAPNQVAVLMRRAPDRAAHGPHTIHFRAAARANRAITLGGLVPPAYHSTGIVECWTVVGQDHGGPMS
jgi:divalent metal cation (Fe/Co/Zn/Cd) transporter